jgi:serine/threonine protein kinase
MIGTRLAHYEFVGHLGSGGMGKVWRARDTKLGREVAIKTLSEDIAADAESLTRLQREARLLVLNGFLVYQEFNPKTKRDIWVLPVEASATGKTAALLADAFGRAFSPALA